MSYRRRSAFNRRVDKLEAAAGKGQKHCPRCRLAGWHTTPRVLRRPQFEPADLITRRCDLCHSEYEVRLKGLTEPEREIIRLHFKSTTADFYTIPRAHAAAVWVKYRFDVKESPAPADKVKNDRDARRRSELMAKAYRLTARKHSRFAAKYGSAFHGHLERIDSIRLRRSRMHEVDIFVPRLMELEGEETRHLVCAEMEEIIRGETLPVTAAALEDVRRCITELIAEAKEADSRRKEELRHSEEEYFRSNREWREQRERAAAGRNSNPPGMQKPEEPKDFDEKWRSDPRLQIARVEE